MNSLILLIKEYFNCPEEKAISINRFFKEKTLSKNDFHTREGQFNSEMSFIISGFTRIFRIYEGVEHTQWISGEGEPVTDLGGLMFGKPARWNIQAITDCRIYSISAYDYQQLGNLIDGWHQIEKMFLARCFMTLEDRVFTFLSQTAEQRYEWFFKERKALVNQVPQNYTASMLGMSPETFSRIRNKRLS